MSRQQVRGRPRGPRSRQANSVTQHGDDDEHVDFDQHRKALEYLAGALDLSMVESRCSAVVHFRGHHIFAGSVFSRESQEHIMRNSQSHSLLDNTRMLQLYTHAAVNSMDVVLQGIQGCLLEYSKATGIVGSLCISILLCMEVERSKGGQAQEELHQQLTTSGLVPALSRFTEATLQAVQQLDTSNSRQQQQQQWQQQQQHDHKARRVERTASTLVAGLLAVWRPILLHTLDCPRPDMSVDTALPPLIELTAALYPMFKKERELIDTSLSIPLDSLDAALSRAAASCLSLAEYIVLSDCSERQQLQDIYLTEKLPELLLQLLAYQIAQLHTACGGVTQALQDVHAAAADQHQQQDQQQQPFAGCTVPKSHLALLQSLGLDDHHDSANAETQKVLHRYNTTLSTLCSVFLARNRSKPQLSSSGNSSSSTLDAGQQQLGNTYNVLPGHLLVPTIKMLIEMVLLAPSDNGLAVHAGSLNVILLLLHIAATPMPTTTAAAVGRQEDQEVSALWPWPQLPAAVAAGLLRPVLAQLPQAVMYCLLKTDQRQQQNMKNDRLMTLHSYGSLLIAVCQSVESKHIAAVLKSQYAPDLLVTLAAVEAVIRAQACHLAPQSWKEEQQLLRQQQAESYETYLSRISTTTSSFPVRDILQHPQKQAPVLLLPFALKVAGALLELMQQPCQQLHWVAPSASADSNALLGVRLFTLPNTILTLCQAATAVLARVGTGAATQAAANIRQHPTIRDVLATASEVSHATGKMAYYWWRAVDKGTPSAARDVLPAVLLVRAVDIWSCGLCQLLQTGPSQHLSGAAKPVNVASVLASLLGSVTIITNMLKVLAPAAACLDEAAPSSAAAHEGVATAAEPLVPHRLQPDCNGSPLGDPVLGDYVVSCCLAELLQQGQDLKSALQSAMGLGVDSMEADASVSIMPQTQGSGPVSKLQSFADTLHLLCEAVFAGLFSRYCCSNALCSNLTKLSEWQLVCGKACVCAGCGLARYCSTSCQRQHWSLHKPVCRRYTRSSHDACFSNPTCKTP